MKTKVKIKNKITIVHEIYAGIFYKHKIQTTPRQLQALHTIKVTYGVLECHRSQPSSDRWHSRMP